MIKIEIEGFSDLMAFIKLFMGVDDEHIKNMIHELNKSSDKLIEAERKDANVSTGSYRSG